MGHPAVHFEAALLLFSFIFLLIFGGAMFMDSWTTVEPKTNVPLMMMMMDIEMMNVAEKFIVLVHEA